MLAEELLACEFGHVLVVSWGVSAKLWGSTSVSRIGAVLVTMALAGRRSDCTRSVSEEYAVIC